MSSEAELATLHIQARAGARLCRLLSHPRQHLVGPNPSVIEAALVDARPDTAAQRQVALRTRARGRPARGDRRPREPFPSQRANPVERVRGRRLRRRGAGGRPPRASHCRDVLKMTEPAPKRSRMDHPVVLAASLVLATFLCAGMLVARFARSGSSVHSSLLWHLFLA